MRKLFGNLACSMIATLSVVQGNPGHFQFVGPLKQFFATDATPGAVTGGIRFQVVLKDGGKSIEGDSAALTSSAFPQSLHIKLNSLTYGEGRLSGNVEFSNDSGAILEGVRLDVAGATEEYRAKDKNGKEIVKTRAQAAKWASPLVFGDLPVDASAMSESVEVNGLSFKPETNQVTVTFSLSGMAYEGAISKLKVTPVQLDIDAQGRLYIGDVVNKCVLRMSPDGDNFETVATLPDQCAGMAVDRNTGMIYAATKNVQKLFRFGADGADAGALPYKEAGIDGWVQYMRVAKDGALWLRASGNLSKLTEGHVSFMTRSFGSEGLGVRSIDFDHDGGLWVVTNNNLFHVTADGKTSSRTATGDDWHLGNLDAPSACRVDALGNLFVAERGNPGREFERISEFDSKGRFVRVFGRGGSAPIKDHVLEGQVFRPVDMAVGADGRLFVATEVHGGGKLVLIYRPF